MNRAVRLCDLYEHEIGSVYPLADMDEVRQNLDSLYDAYEARNCSPGSPIPTANAPQTVTDGDVKTLELILAITLLAEGGGRHKVAEAICEEVQQQLGFTKRGLSELKDVENTALLVRTFPSSCSTCVLFINYMILTLSDISVFQGVSFYPSTS